TNGQLVDFIAGGTALALGLAGAFGKGPLKRNTSVSAAVATYGATAITGGLAFRFAGGSVGASPAAVAAVCRAKAMLATRIGAPGTPSTPLGGWNPRNVTNAGVVIPQSATQRVGSLIG
ncbi:MAG: hypothetical protein ACREB9_01695, partial [Thermoplasmata archaeon]